MINLNMPYEKVVPGREHISQGVGTVIGNDHTACSVDDRSGRSLICSISLSI